VTRRQWLLAITTGAGAFALGLGAARMLRSPAGAVPESTAAFFTARLADPQGKLHALQTWRNKLLVVNFWATWCPPCRAEIPGFVRVRHDYLDRGVEFIGIALDRPDKVASFAREMRITYPLLIADSSQPLASQLGNARGGLPFTVLIDSGGHIRHRHLGALPETQLRQSLEAMLAP
jgi:peroxiredoxin